MSAADTSSGNPLYDMSSASSNPLYDLQSQDDVTNDVNQSANPLYDMSATEPAPEQPASGNPLYDLENSLLQQEQQQDVPAEAPTSSVDLLGDLGGAESCSDPVAAQDESVSSEQQSESLVADDSAYQSSTATEAVSEEVQLTQTEEPVENGVTEPEPVTQEDQFADSGLDTTQVTSQSNTSDQWVSQSEVVTEETQKAAQVEEIVSIPEPAPAPAPEPVPEPTPAPVELVCEMDPTLDSPPVESSNTQLDFQQEVLSAEGGVFENEPQQFQQWQNEEEEEEGIHESVPIKRDDVVREADRDITADLPAVGSASSLKAKWASGQIENEEVPKRKRSLTPPIHGTGGEYVSEPRSYVEKYEGKAEAGVFESEPQQNPDVVNASTALEEALPEQGFAKNVAARFKELEKSKGEYVSPSKRELTPDRTGKAEYVSEPRTSELIVQEQPAESGVFESQPQINPDVVRSEDGLEEALPEQGTAKNLASRFKQMSAESAQYQSPRAKRELTPDTNGQYEYVSEPRTLHEEYEAPKVDAGVFENTPTEDPNVVKSDSLVSRSEAEEFVPERGFAKNVAARFKELESNASTYTPPPRRELTPPPEDVVRNSGVYESTPVRKEDVVTAESQVEEKLPERGTASKLADRFRQMESTSRSPGSGKQKEFTPPPGESGVFESQPKQFEADYNRPAESGIIENTPEKREGVVRGDEPPKYEEELPERGFASKMLNQWKQKESESAKGSSPGSAGRVKEFTPPREEPRVGTYQRTPRTPMSPGGQMDNGSVHPSDLPGQYQPQNEESVFESEPERNPDVVREEDTDWTAGMPKKGAANKMLAKFQKIQSEAKQNDDAASPRGRESESESIEESETESRHENGSVQVNGSSSPVHEHIPENGIEDAHEDAEDVQEDRFSSQKSIESSEPEPEPPMENARLKFEDPAQVGRSKSMRAAIQLEKCGACEKTVYAMERLEMNKKVYHKACFRCSQCKSVLTPKTFAINNEVIFCTNHYKQLFARKGNYDEGFGRTQHKKRWNSNPDLAAAGEGNDSEAKS